MVRDLLILNVDPSRANDPEIAGEAERDSVVALAARFSREDLLRAFDLLTRAEIDIRVAAQPRYHLEMALLRWMHLRKLMPIEDLIAGASSGLQLPGSRQPQRPAAASAPPPASRVLPDLPVLGAPRVYGDSDPPVSRAPQAASAPAQSPPRPGPSPASRAVPRGPAVVAPGEPRAYVKDDAPSSVVQRAPAVALATPRPQASDPPATDVPQVSAVSAPSPSRPASAPQPAAAAVPPASSTAASDPARRARKLQGRVSRRDSQVEVRVLQRGGRAGAEDRGHGRSRDVLVFVVAAGTARQLRAEPAPGWNRPPRRSPAAGSRSRRCRSIRQRSSSAAAPPRERARSRRRLNCASRRLPTPVSRLSSRCFRRRSGTWRRCEHSTDDEAGAADAGAPAETDGGAEGRG